MVAELAAADGRRPAAAPGRRRAWSPRTGRPPGAGTPGAVEQLVIDEVLAEAGVRRPHLGVGAWALPVLIAHGTPDQQERLVRPTLRGELSWCQLFCEPGAGSDLAALTTRAERVDGGWSLTGQKVWTSVARQAHWGICLARTDPDAPKHDGITYFLVDMASPGIEVRPLRELTGAALFNEVFFDEVFVPDECVVGEVDGGGARPDDAGQRAGLPLVGRHLRHRGRVAGPPGARQERRGARGHRDPRSAACWPRPSRCRLDATGRRSARWPAPTRARGRACASCWGPSTTSGSTSSASAMMGPEGAVTDGRAARWAHGRCWPPGASPSPGGPARSSATSSASASSGLPRDPEPEG